MATMEQAKEFAINLQRLRTAATYILDNPGSQKAYAVRRRDETGKYTVYYSLCCEKQDAEGLVKSLNDDIDLREQNDPDSKLDNDCILEIPDVKSHKKYLLQQVNKQLASLEKDTSEAGLRMLTFLASQ